MNGSGTRSSLMYETLRIVNKLKPKYVIWENVKNVLSKKHKHNFDNYLDKMQELGYKNYYQVLDAKDYGIPQHRERVFVISILKETKIYDDYNSNIRQDQNTIGTLTTNCGSSAIRNGWKIIEYQSNFVFPQKEELKLRLKDMLEPQVDEKYYLSNKMLNYIVSEDDKYKVNKDLLVVNRDIACSKTTREGNTRADTSDYICNEMGNNASMLLLKVKNANKQGYDIATIGDSVNLQQPNSETRRGRVGHEVSQTLQTTGTMGVVTIGNYTPSNHEASRVVDSEFIAPTVKENHGTVTATNTNDLRIRKLTPKECWRLMGFTDEEFEKAEKVNSNAQLYKQAGNSIVVNVLEKILNNLLGGTNGTINKT